LAKQQQQKQQPQRQQHSNVTNRFIHAPRLEVPCKTKVAGNSNNTINSNSNNTEGCTRQSRMPDKEEAATAKGVTENP